MYDAKSPNLNMDLIPDPAGFKVLIALPEVNEKTAGGIYIPGVTKEKEEFASIVGYVVKLGREAYQDANKFPNGPWCKEGDWVMFRSYSGTRFRVMNQMFILVNDDTIDGVVANPSKIERA